MFKDKLYMFKVERSDPDKEYYLLSKYGDEDSYKVFCFLRKDHAVHKYKRGDIILATPTGKQIAKYFEVSQKIPSHIINVLKFVIPKEEREKYDIYFDRASSLRKASRCKVGVWGKAGTLSFFEITNILKPYYEELKKNIPFPIFIPSGVDYKPETKDSLPESFILNALLPFPQEKIVDYLYEPYIRRIKIYLRSQDIPLCMWKDYENVKLTAKLVKFAYVIHNLDTNHEITIDPYGISKEENFIKGGETYG